MTRKVATKGIGKALGNEKRRQQQQARDAAARGADAAGLGGPRSVLEQSSLDDLIATVELRRQAYAEATGEAAFVEAGPRLVAAPRGEAELAASRRRKLVPIPRRPPWREGMAAEALQLLEAEAFSEWRRELARAVQEEGLHLTPFERNLDFWRQLWRCVERSDLVVQIVDARDPDFYYCSDLQQYVAEVGASKRLLLLVNKADFLSLELREHWAEHFAASGIDAVFFSALLELRKQQGEQLQQQERLPRRHRRAQQEGEEEEEEAEEEEAEEEEEGHQQTGVRPSRQGVEDAAEVPVPGLDSSDDELSAGGGSAAGDAGGGSAAGGGAAAAGGARVPAGRAEAVEEPEEESPLGPLVGGAEGIADSAQLLEELASRLPAAEGARRGTVGFVGFPNVGKSTVINALVGAKKVGMSRTPGKTKHIQTLELPELGLTLCDCPGLVFPSVAASRAHLVISNTMPLDDLRECLSPVGLIVDKVGVPRLLECYGATVTLRAACEATGSGALSKARNFLAALALSRGHTLRAGVPDEDWAARKVLRDYVSGRLLHCECPPTPTRPPDQVDGVDGTVQPAGDVGDAEGASPAARSPPATQAVEEEDDEDFGDVEAFLQEARRGNRPRNMTKRQMRFLSKQGIKQGAAPTVMGGFG